MTIERRTLVYDGPGGPFEGVMAWDDAVAGARPGVMIVPNILGQKEADNRKADALAALGYVGFACDVFGQGKRTTRESPQQSVYMDELNADRALLRDRLHASLAAMTGQAEVDPARTAAIGYCFGGKAVIDLVRSGADVLGVVSFHGLYDRPDYDVVTPYAAKLLVCHGWDDPLSPPDALVGLGEELTAAGADWQVHAYGHAGHAFTDAAMAGSTTPGFGYRASADDRSWRAARAFLGDLFSHQPG